MKENKIALVLAIIVITITLVAAISYANNNKVDLENLDIKVYKLYEKEDSEDEHVYRECLVGQDKLATLVTEFNKSYRLNENKKLSGKQITGSYKLIYKDKFIAFDNSEDNIIYLGENNALYEFKSDLYKTVIDICN